MCFLVCPDARGDAPRAGSTLGCLNRTDLDLHCRELRSSRLYVLQCNAPGDKGGGSLFGCRAFGNSFGCMLNMTARGNGGSPQPRLITLKPCLMGSCCPGGNPARLVPCGDSLGCHIQQWRCSRAMGNNTLRPDNRLCRLDSPWVCIMSLTTPKMDPHHCGCCG